MNAIVATKANATGLMTPSDAKRNEVAQRLTAMARSTLLGPSTKAADLQKLTSQTVASDGLDRDMFLELLVNQMRYQDPLEPVDNEQMIAQLAQFSTLEQMNQLTESFAELSQRVGNLSFMSASGLIGETVSGVTIEGEIHTGVVERVLMGNGEAILVVDGKLIPISYLAGIGEEAAESTGEGDGGEDQQAQADAATAAGAP